MSNPNPNGVHCTLTTIPTSTSIAKPTKTIAIVSVLKRTKSPVDTQAAANDDDERSANSNIYTGTCR